MDKTIPATAKTLLDAALTAAGELGVTVEYMDPTQRKGPVALRVAHGGQEVEYTVEVRRALRTVTLGAAQQQLGRLAPPALLVTDYVTPALADELKARRIQFLDAAGNAYLEQGPLLVWVKGQNRATKPAEQATGRAFQPTGLQVLFTLLCNPQAVNLPYRELAEMAGPALCWAATMYPPWRVGKTGPLLNMMPCGEGSPQQRC